MENWRISPMLPMISPSAAKSFNTEAGCPALRANQPYPKTVTKMLEYGSRLGFQKGFKH